MPCGSDTSNDDKGCKLEPFVRNKYFYGKLMTVRDFDTEQAYFINKRNMLNRLSHGVGIICGLHVKKDSLTVKDNSVTVDLEPGVALDCCGREIVVGEEASQNIAVVLSGSLESNKTYYLFIEYRESPFDKVPAASNPSCCEEVCCNTSVKETFALSLEAVKPRRHPIQWDESAKPENKSDVLVKLMKEGRTADELLVDSANDKISDVELTRVRSCVSCSDTKVLLAVISHSDGKWALDEKQTSALRGAVVSNAILQELAEVHEERIDENTQKIDKNTETMSKHIKDTNDPHKTIDQLIKDPEQVFYSSNKTVNIISDNNKINLTTTLATSVAKVGTSPVVGKSPNFAPEDHAHVLAAESVSYDNLNDDLKGRLGSGCGFTISPTGDWRGDLDQALSLSAKSDVHIHFRPGEYALTTPIKISTRQPVTISGCGPSTKLNCPEEMVFIFEECDSVRVSDIYVESTAAKCSPFKKGPASDTSGKHISGALTFRDCGDVSVARTTAKCGSAEVLTAACIVVAGKGNARTRIRECRVFVGNKQAGILLIGHDWILVEDNIIEVNYPEIFTCLPVGLQGIVVGGSKAREVRVAGNTIAGVTEGIHIGLSHRGEGNDRANLVWVQDNAVKLTRSPTVSRCRGVFVGNVISGIIQNNYIEILKGSDEEYRLDEGICVYGYFGPRLIASQNHLLGCRTGIKIRSLNLDDEYEAGNFPQWLVANNVAIGAKYPVDLTPSEKIRSVDNVSC